MLHNRLIVSRLFPEAFRELRVQHIASGYRRLLDTVQQQASEIAVRLGVSVNTVKKHLASTYEKHGLRSRRQARADGT